MPAHSHAEIESFKTRHRTRGSECRDKLRSIQRGMTRAPADCGEEKRDEHPFMPEEFCGESCEDPQENHVAGIVPEVSVEKGRTHHRPQFPQHFFGKIPLQQRMPRGNNLRRHQHERLVSLPPQNHLEKKHHADKKYQPKQRTLGFKKKAEPIKSRHDSERVGNFPTPQAPCAQFPVKKKSPRLRHSAFA